MIEEQAKQEMEDMSLEEAKYMNKKFRDDGREEIELCY